MERKTSNRCTFSAQQQNITAKEAEAKRKAEAAKIPPTELFLNNPEFSKFNEKGMPTHDAKGEPVTKSRLKKLAKLYKAQEKAQEKAHKKYLKSLDLQRNRDQKLISSETSLSLEWGYL